MFKYTNTVVINSNKDSLSGLDKWVTGDNYMEVRRVMKFEKPYVTAIYKRVGRKGKNAKVTLRMPSEKGYYRLALYIRLSGSQNSYYSNSLVFKGKPFYTEFEVKDGDTASTVAVRVAKLAKHLQQMYDNKYMNYKAEGDNLVIDGIDEFQRFTQADIQKFNPELGVNKIGEFETLHSAKVADSENHEEGYTIEQGVEAFGDYFHILKDLRLPTAENTSWTSINAEEMPVIGGLYNQYTIHYSKNRGQVAGGGCVGQEVVSQTTHVFYVNQTLASEFETALAAIGVPVKEVIGGDSENKDLDGGELVTTATIDLTPLSQPLDSAASTAAVSLTVSNANSVTAKSLAKWIHISEDTDNTTVKFTVDENTGSDRTGYIGVTLDNEKYQKIKVAQKDAS